MAIHRHPHYQAAIDFAYPYLPAPQFLRHDAATVNQYPNKVI
ncbi:hypothetical protein [Chromatium okenii]|nr:hypothetical protein [Chromatium okenii]